MKTQSIPDEYQHISPAGAEVRVLMNNELGGIAHCTLKADKTSKVVQHKTVSEFWHVISGNGEIWRKRGNDEGITTLEAGVTIDIPVGVSFQYRSQQEDLVFVCVTMPPWPGGNEVNYVGEGAWESSLN